MIQRLVFVLVVLCLHACKLSPSKERNQILSASTNDGFEFTSSIKHAQGFSIEQKKTHKEIKVYNPWDKGTILRRYALIPRDSNVPKDIPTETTIVKVPVNNLISFSNTHIGAIVKLGLSDKLLGITRANKIYNKKISERVERGEIVNLGGAHNKNIDIEKIVELDPELIILSAFNGVKSGETQLEEVGVKLAYSLSWMESTPLGRAEWMKFTAAFFNREALADSIFNQVEKNYNHLKKLTKNVASKPNVLFGYSYKGTWYMPGGQHYMVSYLRDAGANYFMFDDDTRGSIPMSVETVLDQCTYADFWIHPGSCKSLNEIEDGGEIFSQFTAFKKKEIYNIYKRSNFAGGSDWWETGSVNPDIVLKDFIKVLHPELLDSEEFYFFNKLDYIDNK